MIYRDVAGQAVIVYAYNELTDLAHVGGEAFITATIDIDGAGFAPTDDVNPTALGGGLYQFNLTQDETDGVNISIIPVSSDAEVRIDPILIATVSASSSGIKQLPAVAVV